MCLPTCQRHLLPACALPAHHLPLCPFTPQHVYVSPCLPSTTLLPAPTVCLVPQRLLHDAIPLLPLPCMARWPKLDPSLLYIQHVVTWHIRLLCVCHRAQLRPCLLRTFRRTHLPYHSGSCAPSYRFRNGAGGRALFACLLPHL